MGRGRGKARKLTLVSHEDAASPDDEKFPGHKTRGTRPHKLLKPSIDGHDEVEPDHQVTSLSAKQMNHKAAADIGNKRKRISSQAEERQNPVKEEASYSGGSTKQSSCATGFRQTGSRRKSTPRRAAEAGVKIDIFFSIDTPTAWNQL